MNSIRNITRVVVLISAASLAIAGCKKDEKKAEDGKPGDKPGAVVSLAAKSGFAVLPREATAVGGINVPEILSSNLWKSYGAMAMIRFGSEFQQFKKNCGMDPLEVVESVVAAGMPTEEKGVFVIKGIPRKDAIQCAKKVAEAEGEQVTITEEGKISKAIDSRGTEMHFGWIDDKTMLFHSEGDDKEAIEKSLSGDGGLHENKEMMELLGNVDTKSALWGVARNKAGRNMGPVGGDAVYVSLGLKGGLQIDAGVRQKSADQAKKTAEQMSRSADAFKASPLGKFVSKAQIKADNADVIFKLSLTDAEIQELVQVIMSNPEILGMLQRFGM